MLLLATEKMFLFQKIVPSPPKFGNVVKPITATAETHKLRYTSIVIIIRLAAEPAHSISKLSACSGPRDQQGDPKSI